MMNQRWILTVLIVCGMWAFPRAQVFMNKDSLLQLLPAMKEDTAAVHLLINIGQQYESNEPELAKSYYRRAGELSRKINYTLGEVKFIVNYTYVLNYQGLYDSSLFYNLQSVELSRKAGDSSYLGKTLFNTGTTYRVLGKLEQALQYYLDGQRIFAKLGNPQNVAQMHDLLAMIYYDMHDFDKALYHGETGVEMLRELGIKDGPLGLSLANLGIVYIKKQEYNKALNCFSESLRIGTRINNIDMQSTMLLNMADVYSKTGKIDMVREMYQRAMDLSRKINSIDGVISAMKGLSIYHQYKGNYKEAKKYALEGLRLAEEQKLDVQRASMMGNLSSVYMALGQIDSGYYYNNKMEQVQDSILNNSIREKAMELEKVFEVEKKEERIRSLEKETRLQEINLRQKSNINTLLIALLAGLVLIGLLAYRNYRHKQDMQRRRIVELETEKKLAATEAVLQGQEQERYRLAKDLHDGLGGMLSGIRFSFTNMKENLILTPDNQLVFERALDMLNSSIQEMRRVAHNLMPESLVKFGLGTALQDYCHRMNEAGLVRVSYQSLGMENLRLDQNTSITIYRIVQELLNNVIKHAQAKEAIVQLSAHDGKLDITVEDDGAGFDVSRLGEAKGIGWSNIRGRVDMLNGKLEVHSEPGKGTSVYIELIVP